jgi:hypothetical protein
VPASPAQDGYARVRASGSTCLALQSRSFRASPPIVAAMVASATFCGCNVAPVPACSCSGACAYPCSAFIAPTAGPRLAWRGADFGCDRGFRRHRYFPTQPLKLDPHRGDVDGEEVCEAVDGRLEEAGLRHHPEHWGGSFRSTCAACSSSLSPRRPSPGAQVDTRGDRQHRVDMASTNGVACEEDRAHCNPWKGGALVLTRRWPSSSAGTAP